MCHNKKNTDIIWHVPKGVGGALRAMPEARSLAAVGVEVVVVGLDLGMSREWYSRPVERQMQA